jgi:hypothetical protein
LTANFGDYVGVEFLAQPGTSVISTIKLLGASNAWIYSPDDFRTIQQVFFDIPAGLYSNFELINDGRSDPCTGATISNFALFDWTILNDRIIILSNAGMINGNLNSRNEITWKLEESVSCLKKISTLSQDFIAPLEWNPTVLLGPSDVYLLKYPGASLSLLKVF